MKRKNTKKRTTYLLFALLALLCVGSAELAACRFFAPDLYQKIMSPVRQCLQSAVELGAHTAAEVSAWWSALTAPEEELADPQLAGEPAILSEGPISDPSLTELKESDGKEVLTGGIIPVVYYNQGDAAWAEQPYGSDDIGHYGCGPTAMAMAVSSMGGDWDRDPVQMAQWAVEHGYWAKGGGSYLSIVEGTAAAYGLTASSLEEHTPQAGGAAVWKPPGGTDGARPLYTGRPLHSSARRYTFRHDFGCRPKQRGAQPDGMGAAADS